MNVNIEITDEQLDDIILKELRFQIQYTEEADVREALDVVIDEITFQLEGNLADYDITLDTSGNIVLSRDVVIDHFSVPPTYMYGDMDNIVPSIQTSEIPR